MRDVQSCIAPGLRSLAAFLGAMVLVTGVTPTASPAQGLGDCANPPPQINKKALHKQPAAVQQAVAGFADLILAQGLNVPGVSVAVIIDQDVIFAGGFGCATLPASGSSKGGPGHGPSANGVPATPSTFYRIESVTKVFDIPMSELGKIEAAIFDSLVPLLTSNPPVCSS